MVEMYQDGVEVYCLPTGAQCILDPDGRSPLELEECPMGKDCCSGNCEYYSE